MSEEHIYSLHIEEEIFYVGRTNDTNRRYREHLNDKSGSPKSTLIQNALKEGKTIQLSIIVSVPKGSLGSLEDDEIQKIYDSGGKLTNQIGGNKGVQLTAAERHQLNKDIQYFKATHKPKKGVKGEGWTRERQAVANQMYEDYKAGLLTLDDLKRFSEENQS